MARIFTTPESEAAAKVLMHNITVAGGLNANNLHIGTFWALQDNQYVAAAQAICDEIVNRNFTDVNSAITRMSTYSFRPNYTNTGKYKSFKPEAVAKAIVYFAERIGLYWDDTIRTPYEIDEFKKTILGDAVYKYGRYISAIKDTTTKSRAAAKAGTGTPRVASVAPQNNYKQSGPQSGNIRGLIGNPGEKVYAEGQSYRIEGDKLQSNVPRVFIKPLTASAAHGSDSNKIYISSGNGYTDCTCYFDDLSTAQAFLNKVTADLPTLIKEKRAIANITNLHVAKTKIDTNGYFLVNTEYGYCAVSARTLNEAMSEALEEDANRGACWEKATEGYTREELEELHAWMRRD